MLYNVHVNIKIEPVEGDSRRYRYLFSVVHEPSTVRRNELTKLPDLPVQRSNSINAADLSIDMSTFCKAFPWHFIMNENLELVQLGE